MPLGNASASTGDLVPDDAFPRLSEHLAEHFGYLTQGLIAYRNYAGDDWTLLAIASVGDHTFAVLAGRDHSRPYRAKMPGLPAEANARLTRQVDLALVEPWPQPNMTFQARPEDLTRATEGEAIPMRRIGDDRPARPTIVRMKTTGTAQVWWAGPDRDLGASERRPGLIFEITGPALERPAGEMPAPPDADDFGPLVGWLWDECERFLAARGAGTCRTLTRDPEYEREALLRFLKRKGYPADPGWAREETPLWVQKELRDG